MLIIAGLGNPDTEYIGSRHNVGRDLCVQFVKKNGLPELKHDKKINALISKGKIGKTEVEFILPDTYMNNSGSALEKKVKNEKIAKNLVVVHDDLDLPIGKIKIVFGRGDGGHRGIISVMKKIKTKNFVRVKIGIASISSSGKTIKPKDEEKVIKHVLAKFNPKEADIVKKVNKKVFEILEKIASDGYLQAMNEYN